MSGGGLASLRHSYMPEGGASVYERVGLAYRPTVSLAFGCIVVDITTLEI